MQYLKKTILKQKKLLIILSFFIFLVTIFLLWQKTDGDSEDIEIFDEPNEIINNLDKFENNKDFKVVIIGDAHYKNNKDEKFNKMIDFIEEQNVDLVLTVGDNLGSCNNKSCKNKIKDWKKSLKSLSSKIFITLGNHDTKGDNEKILSYWTESFNLPENGPNKYKELVYSFNYGNSHFVFLESDLKEHFIDDIQLDWLEKDLQNNIKSNTFVIYHEPAFPIKSKVDESLDAKEKQRDKLWKIIDKYNVTAVFSGHEHIHSRRLIDKKVFPEAKNKVYQFIVGNTNYFDHEHELPDDISDIDGLEFVNNEKVILFLEVKDKEIYVNLYSVEGKLLDIFKLK